MYTPYQVSINYFDYCVVFFYFSYAYIDVLLHCYAKNFVRSLSTDTEHGIDTNRRCTAVAMLIVQFDIVCVRARERASACVCLDNSEWILCAFYTYIVSQYLWYCGSENLISLQVV